MPITIGRLIVGLLAMLAVLPALGQTLPNGGSVSSAISVPLEQDNYSFSALSGDGIQVRVAKTSGDLQPRLRIIAPGGAEVVNTFGTVVATTASTFSAPATGTYTVIVNDNSTGQDATGNYNLYFTRVPGANEGGALPNGGVVAGAIDVGDLDSYTFTANAGEGIQVRIGRASGTLQPRLLIHDPNGNQVVNTFGTVVATTVSNFSAPTTGAFTVIVSDASTGQDATGNYNLYFTRAPGANEGGALFDGSTVQNVIDLGDLDSYTFSGTSGQNALVSVTDTSGGALVPRLILYGPSGAQIGTTFGSITATFPHLIAENGLYTIVVTDASTGNDATGSYTINLSGAGGSGGGGGNTQTVPLPLWALMMLGAMLTGLAWRSVRARC